MSEPEYCDYCEKIIPIDHTSIAWDDQSKPCQTCRSVAVRSKKDGGVEVYNTVINWLSNSLGIEKGQISSVPYLYENRRDISMRVGKKFIPTRGFDPPYVYGLYARWYNVKRFWKVSHLIIIPFAIAGLIWANRLGVMGTSMILIGLIVFVALFLLNYLLSYILSKDADHLIVVHAYYDQDRTERIMAHEMAHFIHNYRNFFAIIHSMLDSLLFPFLTSYSEGIASWVEWEYARSKGKPAKISEFPLVYRNGLRLFKLIEKMFGRNVVLMLLKTF